MSEELEKQKNQSLSELKAVKNPEELEEWRIKFIGRKGRISHVLRNLKNLSEEEKRKIGPAANQLREDLKRLYKEKFSEFSESNASLQVKNSHLKETNEVVQGSLHPITNSIRRIQEIMAAMGFHIVEGPEVEEEYYDFDALNIPLHHPARAESDSFYLEPRNAKGEGRVLRTSTSSVQVRSVVENNLKPPFKIASPGRVFRNEKPDATHESSFHQIEALMVGESVTIADYKKITETLLSTFFNKDVKTRLRPGYFPFVEPGFEVDMSCVFCDEGCRVCSNTKWLEMGGAGMVHPAVLKNMNIDPEKFQGFAWGYGIDRFTMLSHSINDIRLFWSGDIRFLKQFS